MDENSKKVLIIMIIAGLTLIFFPGLIFLIPMIIPLCFIRRLNKTNTGNVSVTNNIQPPVQNQINNIKCPTCNNIIDISSTNCPVCGAPIDKSKINIPVGDNSSVQNKIITANDFDSIYRLPQEIMLEQFIRRELVKAGIDEKSNLIPSEIAKRKNILNIIFSILIFVYISLIFFHFPISTYVIGLVFVLIFLLYPRKYNLMLYLKKQIKARPGEKISNIIMNTKNTFVVNDINKKFIIYILAAFILPLVIFSTPKIIYEKVDGGYAVRYYIFGLTNFKTATIPETHNNKKVVSLRGNTFSNMFFLESVDLPNSIKEIRGQAFKNCFKLVNVELPKELEYLGGGAFYNDISIKEIDLPDTLTYLGGEAFYNASSLKRIKLSQNLTEIRGNTFEGCTSLKSIIIPDSVTRIGGHAFYENSSLTEVIISENSKLSEIGSSAFRKCDSLKKITIPSTTSVNSRAFKESPTQISYYGKMNCTSYTTNGNCN